MKSEYVGHVFNIIRLREVCVRVAMCTVASQNIPGPNPLPADPLPQYS